MRKSRKAGRNTNDRLGGRYGRVGKSSLAAYLTSLQDRNPFVLVLVDGDGYLVSFSFFVLLFQSTDVGHLVQGAFLKQWQRRRH